MEKSEAITTLAALAHDMRLDIFRALVRAGGVGRLPGDMARELDTGATTLSNNLKVLSHAGLIHSRREGRTIRYFARYEQMQALLTHLLEDCCGGDPEACRPLIETSLFAACAPTQPTPTDPVQD